MIYNQVDIFYNPVSFSLRVDIFVLVSLIAEDYFWNKRPPIVQCLLGHCAFMDITYEEQTMLSGVSYKKH